MSGASLAADAPFPPFFAHIGGLFGGSICDVLAARGVNVVASRRWRAIAGFAGWVLVTAVSPQSSIASLGNLQSCGGYIGAALAPAITGYLVQTTGSFGPALIVGGIVALSSAASDLFLVRVPTDAELAGVRS